MNETQYIGAWGLYCGSCKKFNHPAAKLVSFVLRSDRVASIEHVRTHGAEAYANKMSQSGLKAIRR